MTAYAAPMRSIIVALLFVFAFVVLPAHATELHRCVGADGISIFTDKHCEDIGAAIRPEPAPASGAILRTTSVGHLGWRGCARTTDDLRRGLQAALTAGDVNQLATFYHWPGISSAASADILKHLQAIADRPLVALNLIRAHPAADANGYQTVASEHASEASAIELVQTRSSGDPSPMRTLFALTRYMGCWWVRF